MAKFPQWMKVSAPYGEGDKVFVNVHIRVRHPLFLRVIWGMLRQEIRRRGRNPNDPRMLWLTMYHLVKIITKAKL